MKPSCCRDHPGGWPAVGPWRPCRRTIVRSPVRQPVALAPQAPRPCGNLGVSALRGTYTFSATGWQDLSEMNPALPKGYAPVTIIGTFAVNGNGELTGSASINAGGLQMSAEFFNSQVGAPQPDCSVAITLTMKIKEFEGAVSGPYSLQGRDLG